MKKTCVLAGLLAVLTISSQAIAVDPIAVTSLTVTGADNANGSNVTVVAEIGIYVLADGGQAMLTVKSTNNLVGQLFQPETLTFVPFHVGSRVANDGVPEVVRGMCTWTNTFWKPYFTGDFVVTVVAIDLTNGFTHALATTVTVVRAIGGTMNSVQVPVDTNAAYDANGAFTNIDLTRVFLHNIGLVSDAAGADNVGCNLLNVTNLTGQMTEEQQDIAYTDTARYRPAGTPFRFNMNLHKRPTSLMGMGEIKRFVWTPDSASVPAGPGRLVLDVTSCSPWRNNYSTNLRAHVGFAPLFMTDTNAAEQMNGMIMCTSAHYMDVGPTNSSADNRMGLRVNGRSNTTSYLKSFISDTTLARMGIPVDRATDLLAGYVTHFNAQNISEGDTTTVTADFTRIAGGTNIVYAYNSGASGDSGYEARLTFTFHSPVAALIGPNLPVEGDFDGDHLADPYVVDAHGNWYIFFSMGHYQSSGAVPLGLAGWQSVASDFDCDGKADPAMVDAYGDWFIWLSTLHYQFSAAIPFGQTGTPVAGDFDYDGKADPAMVDAHGNWYIFFSTSHYQCSGAVPLGQTGSAVTGDFDGDRKADPAMVDTRGNWYIFFSASHYQCSGAIPLGYAGWKPVVGDFDGDRKADPAMVLNNNWIFCFSGGQYAPQGPILLSP